MEVSRSVEAPSAQGLKLDHIPAAPSTVLPQEQDPDSTPLGSDSELPPQTPQGQSESQTPSPSETEVEREDDPSSQPPDLGPSEPSAGPIKFGRFAFCLELLGLILAILFLGELTCTCRTILLLVD
jgi:hypothetical protein